MNKKLRISRNSPKEKITEVQNDHLGKTQSNHKKRKMTIVVVGLIVLLFSRRLIMAQS